MKNYNLNFIDSRLLFRHVRETVAQYRFDIDLQRFNSSLVDPIKLTFDSLVYDRSMEEVIENEITRQLDKSNNNHIGYFHQNIFKYIGGEEWRVPEQGFDIVNDSKQIFVELKNKHNTMNAPSSESTYIKMANTIMKKPDATCMLVEIIAKQSQNKPWEKKIDKEKISDERIRRVSADQFYRMVTGIDDAFAQLCKVLPSVIRDVVNSLDLPRSSNTVVSELSDQSSNILNSLFLFTFKRYEGFKEFDVK